MIPTHCDRPMIRNKRVKKVELYSCAVCNIKVSAPKGYFDEIGEDVTKLCSYEGCENPLPPAPTGRPRRYCSATCRKRAERLRQRSKQLTEEVSA